MKLKAISTLVLLTLVFLACQTALGETYHLTGTDWKKVSDSPDGQYILAVSNIKRLIAEGKDEEAQTALDELKTNFPDIAGPDLDKFMEAEILFAKKKFIKSSYKYSEFMDKYPDSKFTESALERQYSIANAFINGQRRRVLGILKLHAYEEAHNIMYDIADRAGDAPIAKKALVTLAKGYQKRKAFMEAYDTWADISAKWPTGDLGRDALLEMAHSLHSSYRGPRYDSTMLLGARSYYEDFEARYPQQVKQFDVDAKIKLIDEQLALKEYEVGKYYTRAELPDSGDMYYNTAAQKWPDTTAAMMANDILDGKVSKIQEKTATRKTFDAACLFLDTWFATTLIF